MLLRDKRSKHKRHLNIDLRNEALPSPSLSESFGVEAH